MPLDIFTHGSSYVYALGQIETRFPRPSVEKEVAQATGRAETAGQTDQQAFHEVSDYADMPRRRRAT